MTRQEFLEILRQALQGKIKQSKVNEHLQYYENYIMEEARKGRTEQEVIDGLGDPRLIAKTLIQAETVREDSVEKDISYQEQEMNQGFTFHSWYGKAILIALAIIIILVVLRVVAFLLPLVLVMIVAFLIKTFFFGNRGR